MRIRVMAENFRAAREAGAALGYRAAIRRAYDAGETAARVAAAAGCTIGYVFQVIRADFRLRDLREAAALLAVAAETHPRARGRRRE